MQELQELTTGIVWVAIKTWALIKEKSENI